MSVIKRAALIAAPLVILAVSASAQNNAEEVVFSTPGSVMTLTNNTKATETPFGFWIWCSAQPASGSNGGYAAAFACQGSMYFYALDPRATPVLGQVKEGPDGIYTMNVVQGTFAQLMAGTLNPAYTCSLKNTVPDAQGTVNSDVVVNCTFLSTALGGNTTGTATGAATVTNATVEVTGPK